MKSDSLHNDFTLDLGELNLLIMIVIFEFYTTIGSEILKSIIKFNNAKSNKNDEILVQVLRLTIPLLNYFDLKRVSIVTIKKNCK